ncbi:MAG: PLP-dependent aminotransferase family protein [Oscillospiraceae bacterium]|nr:PLP-dependent aminotransferase family protein [Oscillospiraceae bacterium]
MLTYDLSKREKMPVYLYLYHRIKEDILNGILLSEEKLPSKRSLAQHLNISVVTVMNAYDLLSSEGYIYTKPKKGYYVVPIKTQKKSEIFDGSMLGDENTKNEFDFSGHLVSSEEFPFSVWSKLMRKTLLDYGNELLQPMPYNGTLILRKAICQYLFHHCGMNVNPQQVIIGAGTEYLYNLIIQLLGTDKVFAVEDPGYNKIAKIYEMNNVTTKYIEVDSKGLRCDKLRESNANIVHISPSHHYPTGAVMPVNRRNQILNWADETGGYIIEDYYDSEFRDSRPMETLFSTDKNKRVIHLNTFSKTIAPSIRISYLVLPVHLIKLYKEKMNFLTCTVSGFEQYTLAAFINDGYFERHISRMKKHYALLQREIKSQLNNSSIRDKIEIVENKSGLHFLLKIHTEKPDEVICKELQVKGIGSKFLSQCYRNKKNVLQHYLIINYSGLDINKLQCAIDILKAII